MQRLLRLVAVTATAVTVSASGWLATVATADAKTPTRTATTSAQVPDVWVFWAAYSTHEKCRKKGRDMIGSGAVVDYRCDWGSPTWSLYLRMVG
ncbi:hypothetical protein K8Z49_37680 [Actinomadura madurae]|uniref:hypothetical protein n=1 Tax=Actinomadura madurae TaxID=1993 RepID=UPI003999C65F